MSNRKPWIPVGELAQGFEPDTFRPAASEELAGRRVAISLEQGGKMELAFVSDAALIVSVEGLDPRRFGTQRRYRATRIRSGIYFVDWLPRDPTDRASISLVLDMNSGLTTLVEGRLPTRTEASVSLLDLVAADRELTAVTATFTNGVIGTSFEPGSLHARTTDLIGRRVEYTYSPHEQYEHVYLNPDVYAWHCLKGREAGLADVDRCDYFGVAADLYLFAWREKIIPTLGVVMIDFAAQKTTGKIFGYESHECTTVVSFPVGARVRVLNTTERDFEQ